MAKRFYYQVNTHKLSADTSSTRVASSNPKKLQLIFVIILVYALIVFTVSWFLNSIPNEYQAEASVGADITASIKIVKEKAEYHLGDQIEAKLTLQNTSIEESINNLSIAMQSTDKAIFWQSLLVESGRSKDELISSQNGKFVLPILSSGERTEYLLTGNLQNTELEFVTLLGEINFVNEEGSQKVSTNKVFVPLNGFSSGSQTPLSLTIDSQNYQPNQEVVFKLSSSSSHSFNSRLLGKIFISDQSSVDATASLDCELSDYGECINSINSLKPGKYTAIFVDDQEDLFSNIVYFKIAGRSSNFTPSSQASLNFPFGSRSENGLVAVNVRRALSLNESTEDRKCIFEVLKSDNLVANFEAQVEQDQSCFTNIPTNKIPSGEGVYTVKLKGTSLQKSISFLNKSEQSFSLQASSEKLEVGQDVYIEAQGIASLTKKTPADKNPKDQQQQVETMVSQNQQQDEKIDSEDDGEPNSKSGDGSDKENDSGNNNKEANNSSNINSNTSNNSNQVVEAGASSPVGVELFIWHPRSGEFKSITSAGGSFLKIINGEFKASLDGSNFGKGGLYRIFLKSEDGQVSDFLNLSFDSEKYAFSQSGILVEDYNNLKAGSETVFKIKGVQDRSGNLVNEGSCGANFYQRLGNPINISGELKNGVCKVVTSKNTITKDGPVLVSFSGNNIPNPINQARQFNFFANSAQDYGTLNLEFEPVRKNYTNKVIIGPVTDQFGNLADKFNLALEVYEKDNWKQPEETVLEKVETEDPEELEQAKPEYKLIKTLKLDIKNGFGEAVLPSQTTQTDNIKLVLVDPSKDNQEILNRELGLIENNNKLVLPNFPLEIDSDTNFSLGIFDTDSNSSSSKCKLSYFKTTNQFSQIEADFNPILKGCEFDWRLEEFRGNQKGLLKLEISNLVFTGVIKQKSGVANNIFEISPQVKLNKQNQLEISLLNSPIVDKNGIPVDRDKLRIQLNGRKQEVDIKNGFTKIKLPISSLSSGDIRNILEQRFLDINIEAKASSSSINKDTDFSIYLGTLDITDFKQKFSIQQASKEVKQNSTFIFKFKSDHCQAALVSSQYSKNSLPTHAHGGSCYVEVNSKPGNYTLIFEENGYTIDYFDYSSGDLKNQVVWCRQNPCTVQVLGSLNRTLEAIIYDEGRQYSFKNDDLKQFVVLSQNGLNPLKDYLVEIRYVDNQDNYSSFFREISGEYLIGSE